MNQSERAAAVALALCKGLERRSLNKLATGLKSARKVWEASETEWLAHCHLHKQTIVKLNEWRHREDPLQLVDWVEQQGIKVVVRGDKLYPKQLLQWGDSAPLVLFAKGNFGLLASHPAVSVVGTRRASSYGIEAARWVANSLAAAGVSVISGMALGIDGTAHQAALGAHGDTIAVLGCGVNVCYPQSHWRLFKEIEQNGLLLSEYSPDAQAAKHHFPERNRIIAGLGDTVVVVQAGEKSGALSTADAALELGRDVYVVPGPITSKLFRGSNQLLRDGAGLLLDPIELLADLKIKPVSKKSIQPDRWAELYEVMETPISAVELAKHLDLPVQVVYAALMELELDGWIVRVPGSRYQRNEFE